MTLNPGPTEAREAADCAVCGAPTPAQPWAVVQGFNLVRCPGCGVRRVSPRLTPAGLQAYYDADYWRSTDSVTRGYFDYPGDEANIRRTFRRRLAWLERRLGPGRGRSLDVGCAYGFLVDEARTRGWDAHGLEWSAHAVEHAPAAVRGRIERGSLATISAAPGTCDLVTLWDYLEHSPDPRADLSAVARLLKPGGWVSLIIPDAGSLLARVQGPRWEEYKKPQEHLYFFTFRQLARLLRELGFEVRDRQWAGKYASLAFACSRFKPGDGWIHPLACAAGAVLRGLGQAEAVWYINPRDKRHVLARKK
jgi:SAM-dependent methyltransferase